MVKLKVSMNPQGQIYIPKQVREELKLGDELELIGDARAVVLFSKDMGAKDVLKSVEVIIQDLRHRAEMEEEGKKRR